MFPDRKRANIIYSCIGLVPLVCFWLLKFDKPLPIKNYIYGIVLSRVLVQSRYSPGIRAYIRMQIGVVKTSSGAGLRVGQQLKYRIYKSELTGRIKYVRVRIPITNPKFTLPERGSAPRDVRAVACKGVICA